MVRMSSRQQENNDEQQSRKLHSQSPREISQSLILEHSFSNAHMHAIIQKGDLKS